jgi:hypothetical protein
LFVPPDIVPELADRKDRRPGIDSIKLEISGLFFVAKANRLLSEITLKEGSDAKEHWKSIRR